MLPTAAHSTASSRCDSKAVFHRELNRLCALYPKCSFNPLDSTESFLSRSSCRDLMRGTGFCNSPLRFAVMKCGDGGEGIKPLVGAG